MELAEELGSTEELILEAMDAGPQLPLGLARRPQSDDDERPAAEALGIDRDRLRRPPSSAPCWSADSTCWTSASARSSCCAYGKGLSQREIAAHVGLSQMHVSRLLRRSIEDMRETIGSAAV